MKYVYFVWVLFWKMQTARIRSLCDELKRLHMFVKVGSKCHCSCQLYWQALNIHTLTVVTAIVSLISLPEDSILGVSLVQFGYFSVRTFAVKWYVFMIHGTTLKVIPCVHILWAWSLSLHCVYRSRWRHSGTQSGTAFICTGLNDRNIPVQLCIYLWTLTFHQLC